MLQSLHSSKIKIMKVPSVFTKYPYKMNFTSYWASRKNRAILMMALNRAFQLFLIIVLYYICKLYFYVSEFLYGK